jgi:hypothetical protein
MDIRVYGAEDIAAVAAAVRKLGDGREIPNAMAKRIRKAVPPLRKGIKASALSSLPSSGGFAKWVARAGVRASIRRGPRTAGITLVSARKSQRGKSDLRRINAGQTRHPWWGDRRHWSPQAVKPGYFDRGVEPGLVVFRHEVNEAIGDAVQKVGL